MPTKDHPAGFLHKLCPACDELERMRREALADAHARGYESIANTPEYKRMQAEREAAKQGRTIRAYVSRAERKRHAEMLRADGEARRVRRRHFKALLLEWNRIVLTSPDVAEEKREKDAAKSREYYHENLQQSRRKSLMYKAAHKEGVILRQEIRTGRMKATDDGTLTVPVVRKLKAQASRCGYCDNPFVLAGEKQTDHMIALCHGGEHSMRNVVIVCRRCNGRKARLTYGQWLDRIEPQHRGRAVALFNERYGRCTSARHSDVVGQLANPTADAATRATRAPRRGQHVENMGPGWPLLASGGMVPQSL